MKRKLLTLLTAIFLLSALAFTFTACGGGNDDGDTPLQEITGITFQDATHDYDGTEKAIVVSGELPTGVSVSYTNNKGTNAGSYNATATLSGSGYKTLNLSATLLINKISYDMSQVAWDYTNAFVYNGTAKTVSLTNLPQGVTVSAYANNSKTDAGSYTASATFNYDTVNYNQPAVSNCNWTIEKATITGVSVEANQSVYYDNEYHLPVITGDVPQGISVTYYIDGTQTTKGARALGTHNFTIVLSGNNYHTLTLTCALKVEVNLINMANAVFDAFGTVPNAWSFFPTSFSASNRAITNIPNYTNFVNVSSIPTNGIGKQLNVAYGLLNKTEKALSFVQPVYSAMNTIKNLYTSFIDKNPEDYRSYSGTAAGITFTLSVGETTYSLSASVSSINVKIFADTQTLTYGARIQLTETTVLKYTVSENSLVIAMDVLDSVATQIEFVRNDDGNVLGYMYEFITLGDKQLRAASTMIEVGDTYTTLIGTKGDFIPTAESRNCEVYLNSTGELVGTEVREKLNIKGLGEAIYNTLWYTINDVSGITNIKKVDEANGLNADTIYINSASKAIGSKIVSLNPINNPKAYSRRFDIEFKTMYFYQYDQTKEEYVEVSCEVPMMFVQEENASTFISDFSNENEDYLSGNISLNVTYSEKNAVNYGYYTLLEAYDIIKDLVTFDMVTNYCKQ